MAEVSVIVPVYNRAGMVTRTLDSIKGQTFRPLELVVVDNNSSDDTPEVLRRWKAANETADFRVTVATEPKRGAAAARNRGFDLSTSPVVIFFDSDDIMYPGMVEEGMRVFHSREGLQMVHWHHDRQNADGTLSRSPYAGEALLERHLIHSILSTPNYLVRRDYFARHGRWNESLLQWDDYELGVRLLLGLESNPGGVAGLARPLYRVILHGDSITGDDFSSKVGRWEGVLDEIARDIRGSSVAGRDRLLRHVTYRRYILAALYAREGRPELLRPGEIVPDAPLSRLQRVALMVAYRYTARGGRGAYRLIGWML